MPQPVLDIECLEGVQVVRLTRGQKRNALRRVERAQLVELLSDLSARRSTPPPVVLASRPEGFSSGQDLAEARDFKPDDIPGWIDEHVTLYRAILSYPSVVVAAVEGCCIGAGFQTALACDLRVAATTSYFGMPELDDGIPCILGTWLLDLVIGRSRTVELALTCRKVSAEEALQWGLVNVVAEPEALLRRAHQCASQLALKSALALRLTKEWLAQHALAELNEVATFAKYGHGLAFASGEPRELMGRFLLRERAHRTLR